MPTLYESALLLCTAVSMQIAQISTVELLRRRVVRRSAPSSFLIIAWNVICGSIFFSEHPDAWTIAGCAIIIFALIWSEQERDIKAMIDMGPQDPSRVQAGEQRSTNIGRSSPRTTKSR